MNTDNTGKKRNSQSKGSSGKNSGRTNRPAAKPANRKPAGNSNKRRKKKKNSSVKLICAAVLGVMVVFIGGGYLIGRTYYSNKFLANTKINDVDVSGMKYEEACKAMGFADDKYTLKVKTVSGKNVDIDLNQADYYINSKDEIKKAFESINHNAWFSGWSSKSSFNFNEITTYDKDKLAELVRKADWGKNKTTDAKIEIKGETCKMIKEVQGDKITNMDSLVNFIQTEVDSGNLNIQLNTDIGCYELPEVTEDTLAKRYEQIKSVCKMSITYDFDYTTEKLSGKTLVDMIKFNDDGSYSVDDDKAMKYVEKIAKKYDTYNTKRKFKSTKQGKIVVPTSDDAKYGWWIDKDRTKNALIEMLEKGKTVKKVDPIYYEVGGYTFTGVEKARKKDDDIGKTYIEVDLTNQHLWYYKDGKKKYDCDIVSGQTTSAARTTLPGVYKLWDKATNYRMKDTNADGDSWDTTCNYWNRIAIVGIGLHDSTWRYAFGGTIYQWNGSHGCINMPYNGAKYIYDNVALGTPVVMYYKSAKK